ncbi:MAG: HAMP domain-containing histidine kinase [Burkholderiales bacterium]|nr:HAMP domain-containing histidine kinase [Anaerolineae bacterium]
MTHPLSQQYRDLQEQMAQRTLELEERIGQLDTLNRITQTVTTVHNLEETLGIVAREMVLLLKARNSGITLLNEERTELTVVADYFSHPDEGNTVGVTIPLAGNPSSIQVVQTGRSIVVPHAQTNPLTESIHPLMRRRGTECLLIVPLLARGEVIGTIGVATGEPDREFTPAELSLVETIAGQIAGAIENARLFSEMQRAKETAEGANAAKSTFLASVSHELRTPLTSVLGFARIIQKRLDERILPAVQSDDPKTQRAIDQVRENIGIILSEGNRLTTLINNVLDLAKIEAGKEDWHMQSLSASEVVEQATAATSSLFEQRERLNMITDVVDDLPQMFADRDRLIQVLINLISNAVKFTEQGAITCRVKVVDSEIIFSISDTGMGIVESDQPRVFEKFTQVGDTLTGKPMGTGLGLPICKEIVEHHGGRIWVESVLGQGSVFSFTIPTIQLEIKGGGAA